MRYAVGNDARLAGTRARDDEERPFDSADRLQLRLVEV
jgi:hypothetical protein